MQVLRARPQHRDELAGSGLPSRTLLKPLLPPSAPGDFLLRILLGVLILSLTGLIPWEGAKGRQASTTCSPPGTDLRPLLTGGLSGCACRNPSRKTLVTSGFMAAESELSVSEPGDLVLPHRAGAFKPQGCLRDLSTFTLSLPVC